MDKQEYKKQRVVNKVIRFSPTELYFVTHAMKKKGYKTFSAFVRDAVKSFAE